MWDVSLFIIKLVTENYFSSSQHGLRPCHRGTFPSQPWEELQGARAHRHQLRVHHWLCGRPLRQGAGRDLAADQKQGESLVVRQQPKLLSRQSHGQSQPLPVCGLLKAERIPPPSHPIISAPRSMPLPFWSVTSSQEGLPACWSAKNSQNPQACSVTVDHSSNKDMLTSLPLSGTAGQKSVLTEEDSKAEHDWCISLLLPVFHHPCIVGLELSKCL